MCVCVPNSRTKNMISECMIFVFRFLHCEPLVTKYVIIFNWFIFLHSIQCERVDMNGTFRSSFPWHSLSMPLLYLLLICSHHCRRRYRTHSHIIIYSKYPSSSNGKINLHNETMLPVRRQHRQRNGDTHTHTQTPTEYNGMLSLVLHAKR